MAAQAKEATPVIIPANWRQLPGQKTEVAAALLMRKPQTLRKWAMRDGAGPIRAKRLHGRLVWATADIIALLNEEGVQ